MLRALMICFVVITGIGLGAEITENLPAGGKFVFESKWDKYTINCTADPVVPVVLTSHCTCTQYDMVPWTNVFRYQLKLSTVLSNGKSTHLVLADGNDLKTLADCEKQRDLKHSSVCKVTR